MHDITSYIFYTFLKVMVNQQVIIMNESSKIPQECLKIMERLYIFVDTKDVQLNARLNLVVNPQIIKILFKQVQEQSSAVKLQLFRSLSKIYRYNQFNSLILAKRDKQIMEFNHSILQSLIVFIFSIKIQQEQIKQVAQLLVPFIHSYPINCKIIKCILFILIKDFYDQKINHTILQLSIYLLRNLLKHQKRIEDQPCNYFITYGQETGIKMINRNIKWPFSKGFHFYLKFSIQNFIKQEMTLFNLSIEQDDFIAIITPQGQLKFKIFSSSQLLSICTLPKDKWITLSVSYTIKSKLLRNFYELICVIDGQIYERRDLPVPSISMSDQIVDMTLCRNFYGKMHAFIMARTDILLGNKLIMNTWNQIQSFLVINKKNIRELFVFYSPILCTTLNNKQIVYDISSQNHGEMFQNTGIHYDPFRQVDINYYGGLYTYLPFIHLLKFYQHEKYPRALTDIFQLFLVFFENKFVNVESEAINCQFFSIASQLINEINPNYLQVSTIKVIKQLNSHLTNMSLRKDMLINFLFKINIRKLQNEYVINGLHEIIQDYFTQYFEWSFNLITLDDVFHYIIDNLQEEQKQLCCLYHYCQIEKEKDEVQVTSFKNNYLRKNSLMSNLLKAIFINIANSKQLRPIKSRILQILFNQYSSCLKILLLQSINEGVKVNSKVFIEDLNLLQYIQKYLEVTQLPEELACLFQILLNCHEQDFKNKQLRNTNIHMISGSLYKIYTRKCEEGRFRGKTSSIRPNASHYYRKHSSARKTQLLADKPKEGTRRSSQRKQKNLPLQLNRNLYEAIIKLCFEYNYKQQTWLLKHDDFCFILQPYFRICCLEYRKNIINMIRNTVVSAFIGKKITSKSCEFDKLYKLLLTEFILKELQQSGPDCPSPDLTNDIIMNVYFVIDYTVINMREDWMHLYAYLLRLNGILQEAKKEISEKYHKSLEDISIAAKLSNRKFVIRVIKVSEKNVFNFSNIIFLINLIIFGNYSPNNSVSIFKYFKSIQKYLFVSRNTTNAAQKQDKNKITFLDSKIILQTVNSFKVCELDLMNAQPNQVMKIVNAYLDLQYTHEKSDLFKSRFMYLIRAEFKQLKSSDHSLRDLFVGLGQQNNKKLISTGQIISILICLCIECGLNTEDKDLFQQSVKSLKYFFLWFMLLSSRDGLKQQRHSQRNSELPKTIAANVLHFLYSMLHGDYMKSYLQVIEDLLYSIFCFMGQLVRCLSQKLGNPQNFERGLERATVMKNVQQYNFFVFDLLKNVLAIKDLKSIPDSSKEKVIKLIHHQKVSSYFKNNLSFSIQSKIDEASINHMKNMADLKQEVQQFFKKSKEINQGNVVVKTQLKLNNSQFQKQFIFDHLKNSNLNYRKIQRVWIKIWKRLRLYHYFWSISLNQRQKMQFPYVKNAHLPYKNKFSKYVDHNGVRPVLSVTHVEPWHVKKVLMEKQFEYRNSNYLYHLHEQIEHKKKQKSFLQKLIKLQEGPSIFYVDWIKHNSKRKGYLTIQNEKLKFKYLSTFQKDSHLQFSSFILAQYKPVQKFWPLVEIVNIISRRYLAKRQCLLIEFQDGTSLIFNFLNQDKDDFVRLILARQNKTDKISLMKYNKITFYTRRLDLDSLDSLEQMTALWRNHKISNFQYLMLVNKYAGRSYLDPANYPVFPWIIATYDCQKYTYRDLSKTMGALGNEQRINFFHNKMQANDPFDPVPPYQYGTHYSSPGMVFNFLIRLQPYTQASRTLQGGKFDLPDRLFSSVKVCWQSVTSEVSDVRELTPEFYYMPQFLLNMEQHDFGITQHKQRIHNVHMPYWASSAYEYIVTQRREFESDYVSENIGNWIDLIFGYKQKGKIAEENLNLFYYLTYEGAIELDDITDEQTRISKEAQIMHFGQTPSQIFTKPHGGRPKAKKISFGLKKISLVLSLESSGPMSILGVKDNKMILFHDYNVMICQQETTYSVEKQVRILRNNSKENIYFLEDIQFYKRIQIFGNQKYIAIASYINGDLLVFSLPEGKKVEEKKGSAKLCLLVNQKQDLMLVGGKNGLLQVYQIVYGERQTLTLIKIASEYYMAPINSISEGGRFFCISSGSMVTLIRASRALNYIYDKSKMKGVKMIRSLQIPKKVEGCLISTDPLFCFVVFTPLELYCYSGNGQLLATRQAELNISPVKFTQNFMDYIAYIENHRLKIMSLPFFIDVRDMQLPNKSFVQMKFYEGKCYLASNLGEIITLSEDHEQNE